jgi:hypothetical protein
MQNPYRALRDWPPRRLARARGRGGLHVFWFYMSFGLLWGLFMFGLPLLLEFCSGGALDPEGVQAGALVYFAGALLIGLVMWATQEVPRAGRRRGGA